MSTWIDFKALRDALSFEAVLRHYGVEVKRKGNQHLGYCPLPQHNGKRNSPSFSANLERGIFQCFGNCGAKGNILDFACLMEHADPNNGEALRTVAAKLQKQFGIVPAEPEKSKAPKKAQPATTPAKNLPVVANAPLDFDLKGLDANHPYLLGRGFTAETIEHFGLGFCSRGMLKDRVAIPLHDHAGQLIGYAGRVVDDSKIREENPRYRFPGQRERNGNLYEFRKSLFLYNGFRIRWPLDDLIVVEGFTSVWWLTQNGLPNVVAMMGADCSEEQTALIVSLVKPSGHVWVLSDGDPAGERFAHAVLRHISIHRFVRWVKLEEGQQPTDLAVERLKKRFTL